METDGRKSLGIATQDKNYVLLGECHWGRVEGVVLMEFILTNYVLADKFCIELMPIRQGPRDFYLLTRIMYLMESY